MSLAIELNGWIFEKFYLFPRLLFDGKPRKQTRFLTTDVRDGSLSSANVKPRSSSSSIVQNAKSQCHPWGCAGSSLRRQALRPVMSYRLPFPAENREHAWVRGRDLNQY